MFLRIICQFIMIFFFFLYTRRGQMNIDFLAAFEARALAVRRYLSGELRLPKNPPPQQMMMNNQFQQGGQQGGMMNNIQLNDTGGMGMDMFGGNSGIHNLVNAMSGPNGGGDMRGSIAGQGNKMRNEPLISFGNHRMSLMGNLGQMPNHRMSLMGRMSHASYGRAMSGLSALSIDWENLEDFDVNVDNSAHINNDMGASAVAAAASAMGGNNRGQRGAINSSMGNPNFNNNNNGPNIMNNDAHVQFNI